MPRRSKYAPDQIHARPETVRGFRNTLLDLIVDAERAAWILATYPPEDVGRPGVFAAAEKRLRGSARNHVRNLDAGSEPDAIAEQNEMEPIAA